MAAAGNPGSTVMPINYQYIRHEDRWPPLYTKKELRALAPTVRVWEIGARATTSSSNGAYSSGSVPLYCGIDFCVYSGTWLHPKTLFGTKSVPAVERVAWLGKYYQRLYQGDYLADMLGRVAQRLGVTIPNLPSP